MNNASSAMLHDEVPVRRCLMHYNPLTMISTESLSQEWLESVSKKLGYPDKGLLEKAIRALSLLELLVKAGCPLCFNELCIATHNPFYEQ